MSCKQNPRRIKHHSGNRKGNAPWNKGKQLGKGFYKVSKKGCKGRQQSQETKNKLSDIAKSRNFGGYVKGSGRGKKGWYKDIWCDSSWELAYIIWCQDHGKNIQRCHEKRFYTYHEKREIYYPDFVVDGEIVEVKGYITEQVIAKQTCNPDVRLIGKEEIYKILKYAKDKHGNNFTKLFLEG